jgi:ribonuclease BN (tRNA processing enzyme)
VVGLTFLIDALAVTNLQRIQVIGDAEKLNVVRQHLYHELLFPVEPNFEFRPLPHSAGSLELQLETVRDPQTVPARLTWFPLEHPGGSLGYCLEVADKKLAYITDTTARAEADYLRHLSNSDLLLHECYFDDQNQEFSEKTGHSWLSAVTEVVRRVKPRQTALIHINPLAELLGNGFSLTENHRSNHKMLVAEDGMRIEF